MGEPGGHGPGHGPASAPGSSAHGPRGRGRAWERGAAAEEAPGTEPPGPAEEGAEPPDPREGSGHTEPPGPAREGRGTVPLHPRGDAKDTEPPGPAAPRQDPGTAPPGPQEGSGHAEPPGPARGEPGSEPLDPQQDGADSPPPGRAELPLVPAELRARLLDPRDYRRRARAVEQLRRALEGCSPAALSAAPAAALRGLIALLDALLRDPNFAVARGALEATRLLALRLGRRVPAVLAPLVAAAARALGDTQPAMRRDSARLLLRLMGAAGPRAVLRLLLQERLLRHRSARLREELLNTCTAALLTYPGEQLDLPQLAAALAPALLDAKRRVRHAALEALAALAAAMGAGGTQALFSAVGALELRAGGAGAVRAVRARLARKALPRLGEQGFVEYGLPLPSAGHCRGRCQPPGADTEWLLMGSRTQSARCGCPGGEDAPHGPGSKCAEQGMSPRRVLSAGRGKNKLPWESELAGDGEGGSGVRMPFPKGVEQFSASSDFLHSPKLQPSQGVPASQELFFSRKRASRTLLQSGVEVNSGSSAVCAGAMGSHQPQISGKCGTLGYPQARGKSGSVDSELQLLGLNNCQQDKVSSSLNFPSKTQRGFCTQAEPTMSFQGLSASQGTFILPCYPLSSPRNSPKHLSSPAASPRRAQDHPMSLSNSWPRKSFEGLPKPGSQKQLLSPKSGDNTGENVLEKPSLQLQPRVVRPPLPRRGLPGARPVPPIPRLGRAGASQDAWLGQLGRELAAGLAQLHVDAQEVDQQEMQNSLRSLRNSAAKKRAKLSSSLADLESPDPAAKLDGSGDCPSQGSSPSESGIYSQESLPSPVPTLPRGRRVMSDTFPLLGSKSHPAEGSPGRSREPGEAEHPCSTGLAEPVPGFAPMDDLGFLSGDTVVVVGKGVFGSPPARAHSQSLPCVANGDDQGVREETEPSPGIPGRSFQQNSASHVHADNDREIKVTMSKSAQDKLRRKRKEEKELNHKEHQEGKDLEGKEEIPWEGLRLSMSEPERLTAERFNLCGDILTSPRNGSLSLENVALNPSLRRTSSLKRSKCSPLLDSGFSQLLVLPPGAPGVLSLPVDVVPAEEAAPGARGRPKEQVTHSPEVLDPSELQPFPRPDTALAEALALLADDDWEKKIEGLNFVRCLSAYHAPVLTAKLHETSLAVAQEVKNLRSGVSRAAVVCLGDLFTHLKKSMDQELDNAVKVLLHKAGESNTFIREEVDKALKAMVNNVTPARALCSLINGGQSHLHSAVRRCTAQHLSELVERLGPERVLGGPRPAAERLLPASARFAQDSSQQTRYYGRRMLFSMMAHPEFEKALERYIPAKDLPYIKDSVGSLREKGLGEMPLDTPSAKGRRSQTGSVGHLRSSPTSRDALSVPDRDTTEAREVPRKAAPRSALESEEYVKDIVGLLNAKDFRERITGIRQLLLDTENSPGLVVANLVKIFDAFKSRLHDSNSKVNQVALETMHKMIPLLKDNLSPVINMLIPAIVDNNLNSKNPGIYTAATNVIQALCQHLDTSLLLQPFCTKAQFLNGKAKQDLTEKLADLVMELYPRKPCAVEQKVLAVLWHLLGNTSNSGSVPGACGSLRTATARLAKALFAQMGPSLLAHAAAQPAHIRKGLEELLETGT
ncbi:TOG array regulator of axonemal microtubules protein 1 isoform X2 [Manacus candei]|uniref:TOG array regulator of axonemal microtubules protein 1 isoform X2 n=1 Tax=Manacus candei TaxID=415023 RepID=UPI0022271E23|nr:TOG array regulator of axonemal microtubules protein 1 isoform X2 [Manacus candei]